MALSKLKLNSETNVSQETNDNFPSAQKHTYWNSFDRVYNMV